MQSTVEHCYSELPGAGAIEYQDYSRSEMSWLISFPVKDFTAYKLSSVRALEVFMD